MSRPTHLSSPGDQPAASRPVEPRARPAPAGPLHAPPGPRPRGRSYDDDPDWGKFGLFGTGLAIGLALGAGVALLAAPRTGEETRDYLAGRMRRVGSDAADRWDDLRDELRWRARRGRTRAGRGLTRGRWAAEDALARGRHAARRKGRG